MPAHASPSASARKAVGLLADEDTGPVTLAEVSTAARAGLLPLAAETAGYLALALADNLARTPMAIDESLAILSPEGTVALVGVPPPGTRAGLDGSLAAERSVRQLLARWLESCSSPPPALRAVARRAGGSGIAGVVAELEEALIPVNRGAARRGLSRLAREAQRARLSGRLKTPAKAPPAASIRNQPAPAPAPPPAAAPVAPPAVAAPVAPPPVAAPRAAAPAPAPALPPAPAPAVAGVPPLPAELSLRQQVPSLEPPPARPLPPPTVPSLEPPPVRPVLALAFDPDDPDGDEIIRVDVASAPAPQASPVAPVEQPWQEPVVPDSNTDIGEALAEAAGVTEDVTELEVMLVSAQPSACLPLEEPPAPGDRPEPSPLDDEPSLSTLGEAHEPADDAQTQAPEAMDEAPEPTTLEASSAPVVEARPSLAPAPPSDTGLTLPLYSTGPLSPAQPPAALRPPTASEAPAPALAAPPPTEAPAPVLLSQPTPEPVTVPRHKAEPVSAGPLEAPAPATVDALLAGYRPSEDLDDRALARSLKLTIGIDPTAVPPQVASSDRPEPQALEGDERAITGDALSPLPVRPPPGRFEPRPPRSPRASMALLFVLLLLGIVGAVAVWVRYPGFFTGHL